MKYNMYADAQRTSLNARSEIALEFGVQGGERPNILNIVASRNYLATFDSQQLATLPSSPSVHIADFYLAADEYISRESLSN